MNSKLENKTPVVNPKADLRARRAALSPIQVKLLDLIDGTATVDLVFQMLGEPADQAREALALLINANLVYLAQSSWDVPVKTEKTLSAKSPDNTRDEPAGNDWEDLPLSDLLEDVPDSDSWIDEPLPDFLGEESQPASEAVSFDQMPEDAPEELQDWEAFEGVLDELFEDGSAPAPSSQKRRAKNDAIPSFKHVRMDAIPGERLPEYLFELAAKEPNRSYRIAAGEIRMVLDFFQGELVKIVPSPPDPRFFLGVLLVRHAGLAPNQLPETIRLCKSQGILQGEALVRMGLMAPKPVASMLVSQAEWRFFQLMNTKKIGFQSFPGRVTALPEIPLSWRSALFNACWKAHNESWLIQWAKQHEDSLIEKVAGVRLQDRGLRTQLLDVWSKTLVSGKSLSYYGRLVSLRPETLFRAIYAFWRVGVIRILKADGTPVEPALSIETLDAVEAVTHPNAKPTQSQPTEISFDSMLDTDDIVDTRAEPAEPSNGQETTRIELIPPEMQKEMAKRKKKRAKAARLAKKQKQDSQRLEHFTLTCLRQREKNSLSGRWSSPLPGRWQWLSSAIPGHGPQSDARWL